MLCIGSQDWMEFIKNSWLGRNTLFLIPPLTYNSLFSFSKVTRWTKNFEITKAVHEAFCKWPSPVSQDTLPVLLQRLNVNVIDRSTYHQAPIRSGPYYSWPIGPYYCTWVMAAFSSACELFFKDIVCCHIR